MNGGHAKAIPIIIISNICTQTHNDYVFFYTGKTTIKATSFAHTNDYPYSIMAWKRLELMGKMRERKNL